VDDRVPHELPDRLFGILDPFDARRPAHGGAACNVDSHESVELAKPVDNRSRYFSLVDDPIRQRGAVSDS